MRLARRRRRRCRLVTLSISLLFFRFFDVAIARSHAALPFPSARYGRQSVKSRWSIYVRHGTNSLPHNCVCSSASAILLAISSYFDSSQSFSVPDCSKIIIERKTHFLGCCHSHSKRTVDVRIGKLPCWWHRQPNLLKKSNEFLGKFRTYNLLIASAFVFASSRPPHPTAWHTQHIELSRTKNYSYFRRSVSGIS